MTYRWTVSPDDEPGVAIVVELAEHPAQRLVSSVDHGITITPAMVADAITDGLAAGWTPSMRGTDFVRRVFAT